MGSAYQLLRCYTCEALHTIGNRTPWSNQCLHRIEYSVSLKLDCCNLENRVLFCMQSCCFQVKCYPNRGLLRHTFNFLIYASILSGRQVTPKGQAYRSPTYNSGVETLPPLANFSVERQLIVQPV